MTATPVTDEDLLMTQAAMSPVVTVDGRPLPEAARGQLVRVVVDLHVGLPDTFELTFVDAGLDVLSTSGLALAASVTIGGGTRGQTRTHPLVEGEVTGIDGSYGVARPLTVVRGSTVDHRLQRVRRARVFADAKDSDLARQIAGDAGVPVGTVDATAQVHPQLSQDNQTDWEFLRERAEEIGYEVGVTEGKLYFRTGRTADGGASVTATAGVNLARFEPRVSTAGLVAEVEVRAWDPANAQVRAARHPIASSGVTLGVGDAAAAARKLSARSSPGGAAANGDLGPAPSTAALVVHERAMTVDNSSIQALGDAAAALGERAGSGFAEAEGELLGDARVVAGTVLKVDHVPREFAGSWTVTRARHVFDNDTGEGYRTWFSVNGRQDRTLLALGGGSGSGHDRGSSRVQGVVGGVVTDVDDPLGLARVRVALPWLSPDYETGWAPVTQLTAGRSTGAVFLPEVADQVLVAFEFGDVRRPYVVGSLVNKRTGSGGQVEPGSGSPGKSAVKAGKPPSVIRRGFLSPSGNRLVFHDDGPPGGGKPTSSQVVLATSGDKVGLTLDQVGGTLKLACAPGSPPGTLTIECDGDVQIKAGASGSMTIDGGTSLTLKGKTVTVEGTGPVAVKGKPIQLN